MSQQHEVVHVILNKLLSEAGSQNNKKRLKPQISPITQILDYRIK